ncbi:hypothetical protein C355_05597 [Cryptococcus neoformans Th84]|nr:hypothetical protein C355_05597 [Cryptococcus neoformans var. grubii Th84]
MEIPSYGFRIFGYSVISSIALYQNQSISPLVKPAIIESNRIVRTKNDLEFSEADNQPLSSSSGADDVAAPTLPSVPLSDDSVSSDISIPRSSPQRCFESPQ